MQKYEIYQLKHKEENHGLLFEPYKFLVNKGVKPDINNYDKLYEGDTSALNSETVEDKLEELYYIFNMSRPADFKGHSLSISDVIAIDGIAYYVDRCGFMRLDGFLPTKMN